MRHPRSLFSLLLLVSVTGLCAAQTRMERGVFSAGAARAGNAVFTLAGTIGQSIVGAPKSAAHRGSFGFWYNPSSISTDVERIPSAAPSSIVIEQNFPNPAITGTTIRFSIPTATNVLLEITDAAGCVRQRMADALLDAGSYKTDIHVRDLSAGVYFFRITAGEEQASRKFIVLR